MNYTTISWTIITIIYCIMGISPAHAQNKRVIDSLENIVSEAKDVNWKSKNLYYLAELHLFTKPSKTIDYVEQSLRILPKDAYRKVAVNHQIAGTAYANLSELDKACLQLDTAIFLFGKAKDSSRLAESYSNLGVVYGYMNDYPKASEVLYKSLEIKEQQGDDYMIAQILNNLVRTHNVMGENQKGLDLTLRSIDIYDKLGEEEAKALPLSNAGVCCFNLNQFDRALDYFSESLRLYEKFGSVDKQILVRIELAGIYRKQQKWERASKTLNKAVEQSLGDAFVSKMTQLAIYEELGAVYLGKKSYKQSILTYQTLLDSAKSQGDILQQINGLRGLTRSYKAVQKFEQALVSKTELETLRDSVLSEEKQEQIKGLEAKYESEKKEQQNILLAKENAYQVLQIDQANQQMYWAIFALFLVLALSVLLVRAYKTKAVYLTNELKHKLLRNQMSPHFIFNALIAIQNYVYKKEAIQAGEYLASFADLVRAILENSMDEYIPLTKEIQWLENYLKLQLMRFDNSFEYEINIDESIDMEQTLIPPMLTQPFIENALEHGLKSIDYKGKVNVNIKQVGEQIHIEVEDNGLGLDATQKSKENKKHNSLAVKITQERLQFLNKKQAKDIHFDMKQLPLKGTLVAFSFPMNYKF